MKGYGTDNIRRNHMKPRKPNPNGLLDAHAGMCGLDSGLRNRLALMDLPINPDEPLVVAEYDGND